MQLESKDDYVVTQLGDVEIVILNKEDVVTWGLDQNREVRLTVEDDEYRSEQTVVNSPCIANDVYFYDGDGEKVHRESTGYRYSGGCVDGPYTSRLQYDLDVDGNTIEFTGRAREGGGHRVRDEQPPGAEDWTFTGDRLLIIYHEDDPPDNWPEALDSDADIEFEISEDIDGSYCPGDRVRLQGEILNKQLLGDISTELVIRNELTGEEDVEDIEVSTRRGHRVRYDTRLPDDASGENQHLITVELGGDVIYEGHVDVGASEDDISITDIDYSDTAFETEEIDIDVTVENSGGCSGEVGLIIGEENIDPVTIRSDRSNEYNATITMPEVDGIETLQYDIEATVGDTTVSDKTVEIEVSETSFEIESVDIPDTACYGEEFEITTTVVNPSGASVSGDLTVEGDGLDSQNYPISNLEEGESIEFTEQYVAPTDTSQDYTRFYWTLEKVGAVEVVTDQYDDIIDLESSDLSIVDVDIPIETEPGEFSANIEVENEGVCGVDVEIEYRDQTKEVYVGSNRSEIIEFEDSISYGSEDIEISVIDLVIDEVKSTATHEIQAVNYAHLDLDGEFIEFVNAHGENVDIEGQIVANDIVFDGQVESAFELAGGRQGDVFEGQISGDVNSPTRIEFSNLRFINIGVTEDFVWVVDGDVEDKSKSFKYGTRGIFTLISDEDLNPDRANTVVVAGPLANIGAIRGRLGISVRFVKKSLIKTVTSDIRR